MNVMNVEKPSITLQSLFNIGELTLNRNHLNAMNMGMLSEETQILMNPRVYTGERSYE